ncbi:hypothetical protein [Streptomyces sp. NPDC096311]|uniref:hypothetical protein n=1 Tax=Streptomyces sp. NPDC096311 TaxID=3366083 RepID=UPI0038309D45
MTNPEYIADLERIMTDMSYGLVGRFSVGAIAVTDILPALERVVFRMTTDNARPAAGALAHRRAAPDPD